MMLGVAQDPVSEGNIGLMMTDIDPQSQDTIMNLTSPTGLCALIIRNFSGCILDRRRKWCTCRRQSITGAFILSILKWQSLCQL